MERPGSPPGGGVFWYANCSCMRQVSVEGVSRALPSAWRLEAPLAALRRRALLREVPRPELFRVRGCRRRLPAPDLPAGLARCALRAFFHTLRAAAACLRARLASRLASFTRLRARLSSSLAIRTRWRATSACNRARSIGSAAAAAPEVAPDAEASAASRAPGGGAPVDRFSLPVFPMRNRGQMAKGRAVSHNGPALATRDFYPQIL